MADVYVLPDTDEEMDDGAAAAHFVPPSAAAVTDVVEEVEFALDQFREEMLQAPSDGGAEAVATLLQRLEDQTNGSAENWDHAGAGARANHVYRMVVRAEMALQAAYEGGTPAALAEAARAAVELLDDAVAGPALVGRGVAGGVHTPPPSWPELYREPTAAEVAAAVREAAVREAAEADLAGALGWEAHQRLEEEEEEEAEGGAFLAAIGRNDYDAALAAIQHQMDVRHPAAVDSDPDATVAIGDSPVHRRVAPAARRPDGWNPFAIPPPGPPLRADFSGVPSGHPAVSPAFHGDAIRGTPTDQTWDEREDGSAVSPGGRVYPPGAHRRW